jgi:hypothetical protein
MSYAETNVGSAGSACLEVLRRTVALERGDTGILRLGGSRDILVIDRKLAPGEGHLTVAVKDGRVKLLRRRGAFDLSGLFHLFREPRKAVTL